MTLIALVGGGRQTDVTPRLGLGLWTSKTVDSPYILSEIFSTKLLQTLTGVCVYIYHTILYSKY